MTGSPARQWLVSLTCSSYDAVLCGVATLPLPLHAHTTVILCGASMSRTWQRRFARASRLHVIYLNRAAHCSAAPSITNSQQNGAGCTSWRGSVTHHTR